MRLVAFAPGIVLACSLSAAAQSGIPEWKLGAAPQLAIGDNGSPTTEFQNVQSVWRLSNGNVVVVNPSTYAIRVFDPKGGYLTSFGRKGQGPGEFESMMWVGHAGDTAIVYDDGLRRISKILLAEQPRLIGEQLLALETPEGESGIVGRLPDGSWLVKGLAMPVPPKSTGPYRIPGYVGIANAKTTGSVKWQPTMPDGDAFAYTPPGKPDRLSLKVRAFFAEMAWAVAGPYVWYGDGSTDSLIRLDPATGSRKTIKLEPGAPVTKAMVDRARARELELARSNEDRDAIRLRYSDDYLPKRLATYRSLIGGPRGELWVERGSADYTAPAEYVVLSAAGIPIARVRTAPGFRIREVGADYVAGVQKDDDGVETVRFYSLRK